MKPRLLYVSFDIVPSPKGAAVHIEQFASVLAKEFGSLQLVTVAPSNDDWQIVERTLAQGVQQVLLPAPGGNLIDRVGNFRRFLDNWWANQYFDIVHFRSPFEGYWLTNQNPKRYASLVFEVNGLPSVELKYRYPNVADDIVFVEKLIGQELACLNAAALVITPSQVTANFLQMRGCEQNKIRVIPNAVDLGKFSYKQPQEIAEGEPLRLLYFGTLTPWQGVEQAIAAAAQASQQTPLSLKILGAAKSQQIDALNDLICRLGAQGIVTILPACTQFELLQHIHEAHVVLAPLTANDRNLLQGCCPFKVLEGMASGTTVLASALPVVLELAGEDPCIFLSKPGSAGSIKDAILEIKSSYSKVLEMSGRARNRIESNYTLERTGSLLCAAYSELLSSRLSNSAS